MLIKRGTPQKGCLLPNKITTLTNLQKITTTIMKQDIIVPCWAINCWKEYKRE